MADPLDLADLARQAIQTALSGPNWPAAMERIIARAHTAAWLAGAAERLGVMPDSALLSRARLSHAERAEIARAVEGQLRYLAIFVRERGQLSDAQIAARALMYAGATRQTYYGARWGDWDIPAHLMPGNQSCVANCKCEITIRDHGDGNGTLTRTMHTEHHCTECPPLAGDHAVTRRR